jgi:hypothetical protein
MIRPVSYSDILDAPNADELLSEYAAECGNSKLGKPTPQRDLYALLEKSGGFQAFGVFDGDKLIGFACVLMYVLPHYGVKIAATESIFVSKEYSGVTSGLLIVEIQDYARKNGCKDFMYSAPVGSRFDHRLSESKRAHHINNHYLVEL